ncbi:MAG: hypothetical protein SH859_07070 [Hyphomicrobium aestuarii]|nr:hypothetical protein [Hyphomicrobium aestuarii]
MKDSAPSDPPGPGAPRTAIRRRPLLAAATIGVFGLGFAVAMQVAFDNCKADGLAFNRLMWSCEFRGGILSLPPGLQRNH